MERCPRARRMSGIHPQQASEQLPPRLSECLHSGDGEEPRNDRHERTPAVSDRVTHECGQRGCSLHRPCTTAAGCPSKASIPHPIGREISYGAPPAKEPSRLSPADRDSIKSSRQQDRGDHALGQIHRRHPLHGRQITNADDPVAVRCVRGHSEGKRRVPIGPTPSIDQSKPVLWERNCIGRGR